MHIPKIPLTKRNVILFTVATSQVSYWTGVVLTNKVLKKKLQKEYDERLEVEVAKVKLFYKTLAEKAKYKSPQDRVEDLKIFHEAAVAMRDYTPTPTVPEEPVISEEEKRNIFDEGEDLAEEADAYAREVENRDYAAPYVISDVDFEVNEPEHDQVSYTYYSDNVLADDKDEIVLLVEKTIGVENLQRFGHFSDNLEIVYVRNENLKMDFEIHRDQTQYRVTVGGADPAPVRALRTVQREPVISARERFERSRGMARGSTG